MQFSLSKSYKQIAFTYKLKGPFNKPINKKKEAKIRLNEGTEQKVQINNTDL
jgi:hypothetical protein